MEGDAGIPITEAEGLLQYCITKDAVGKFISFKCTPVRYDEAIGETRTCMGPERVRPGGYIETRWFKNESVRIVCRPFVWKFFRPFVWKLLIKSELCDAVLYVCLPNECLFMFNVIRFRLQFTSAAIPCCRAGFEKKMFSDFLGSKKACCSKIIALFV